MKFDEVLHDMANHVINDANNEFLRQREKHAFAPFECERTSFSAEGNKFRVAITFEPDAIEALRLAVAKN